MKLIKIGILGAGSFGTALAQIYAKKGCQVQLWGRNKAVIESINKHHRNSLYLKEILLSPLEASCDLEEVCSQKDFLIFTIPTQFLRPILEEVKSFELAKTIFVNTSKGIEQGSLMTPSQIFEDVFGKLIKNHFAALSGPTFALELANQHPSGAALASTNLKVANQIQKALSTNYFRLYTTSDVIGVELGGSLKNVMAIGTGIAEGLGFGLNTRAGLITRCLHEMIKLGVKMGSKAITFSGLSGLGDLILTCTGDLSRNRFVGLELGKGKKLQEITQNMSSVAEGIATTLSVHQLAKKYKVEMTNSEFIYRILYKGLTPSEALNKILRRELKEEAAGIKK